MEHFYKNIDGWFDFEDIYRNQVFLADNTMPSIFVEVGSWLGKSTSFLGVEIFNSNKPIKFYAVDDFSGSPNEMAENGGVTPPMLEFINKHSRDVAIKTFLGNIVVLKDVVNPIIKSSKDVMNQFEDNSINFLFIDSDHSYGGITTEIRQWLPKIKNGGYIGGHDINFAPVRRGVDEQIKKYEIINNSWISQKYDV